MPSGGVSERVPCGHLAEGQSEREPGLEASSRAGAKATKTERPDHFRPQAESDPQWEALQRIGHGGTSERGPCGPCPEGASEREPGLEASSRTAVKAAPTESPECARDDNKAEPA